MAKDIQNSEEDLLVQLSRAVTRQMLTQLESGEISPAELRNILTHLKHNDISVDMMESEDGPKAIALLDDIEITREDSFRKAN